MFVVCHGDYGDNSDDAIDAVLIPQDSPVNSTVFRVHATDVNTIGSWGFVTYRLLVWSILPPPTYLLVPTYNTYLLNTHLFSV